MSGEPADIWSQLAARGLQHLYVDGGITIQRFLRVGTALWRPGPRRCSPPRRHTAVRRRPRAERICGRPVKCRARWLAVQQD
jgi:hypothetical protein